ncbi:MAG: hypothetical protein K2R93_08970 [Gemmatimonadaceae bacterium]|nr:hypothetical protein [Gemmatimonadaceae bacterium]
MRASHIASLLLGLTCLSAIAPAQGALGGMSPGMGRGMMGDSAAAVIMPIVHDLMTNHTKLRRTVTILPNGVRTVTESDDSTMMYQLRKHVSTTGGLVARSQDLNVPPASPVLHALLQNGAKIVRTVSPTPKGVAVTETSEDPAVVRLLQDHAAEVTALVERGMAAMHESMMKRK